MYKTPVLKSTKTLLREMKENLNKWRLQDYWLTVISISSNKSVKKAENGDFPSGPVVKNPPANAGDTGSSPGPGRSHMLQSN